MTDQKEVDCLTKECLKKMPVIIDVNGNMTVNRKKKWLETSNKPIEAFVYPDSL